MRTIWQSLAWKEWHEHKWKLAAVTAVLCGLAAGITLDNIHHDSLASELMGLVLFVTSTYAIAPLAIFLGASDAAEERGRGVQPFLQSLPVPMWQAASWKLLAGLATCILPIVAMLATIGVAGALFLRQPEHMVEGVRPHAERVPLLFHSASSTTNAFVSVGLLACMVGMSIYLWTAAFGANRRNEVQAGAIALLTIVSWWTCVAFAGSAIESGWLKGPGLPLVVAVLGISPGGMFLAALVCAQSNAPPVSLLATAIVAIVFHIALAAWFIACYGRTTRNDAYSPKTVSTSVAALAWIGPPRRGPLRAIVWKQFRESTPIVLAGLAGIMGFLVANLVSDRNFYTGNHQRLGALLVNLTTVIGFLVALAVGIGVFDRDLGPKLNAFWRSRPIHPDLWFWTKFTAGLGVLLVALYLPLFIGLTAAGSAIMSRPESRIMPYFHVAIFVAALAAICLVRQPVYAAILGGGTLAMAVGAVYFFYHPDKFGLETTILVCTTAITVLGTLIAWLTVRYDWGSKNG